MSDLETTLLDLSRRLRAIEIRLGMKVGPEVGAPPVASVPHRPSPGPAPVGPRPSAPRSSGGLLGAVAVLCFILAAVFMVRVALDSGWLTPLRQFGLTVIFGAALISGGFVARERDHDYSGYLAAAGVVVLYLAAYGGYLFFHVIDAPSALIFVGLIGALSLYLRQTFASDLFAVTAAVGVYAGPFFVGKMGEDRESVALYNLVWSTVFCIAGWIIQSRPLLLVSAYCAFGAIGLMSLARYHQDSLVVLLIVQTLQFLIFAGSTAYYSIRHRAYLTARESISFLPVLIFFYATEYSMLERYAPSAAPWVALAFSGVLLALYFYAKDRLNEASLPSGGLVLGFSAIVGFHALYLELFGPELKILLAIVLLAGAAWRRGIAKKDTRLNGVVLIVALLVVANELVHLAWRLQRMLSWADLAAAWLVAAILIFFHLRSPAALKQKNESSKLVLGLAHSFVILSVYQLVREYGSLAVSASWGIYSLAVLGLAYRLRDPLFARSSAIVLTLAAGKVLLYDVSTSAATVRILCLILTGALLYLAGMLFRRIAEFDR